MNEFFLKKIYFNEIELCNNSIVKKIKLFLNNECVRLCAITSYTERFLYEYYINQTSYLGENTKNS